MNTEKIQTRQASTPSLDQIQSLENFQKKYADKLTRPQLTWYLRNRAMNGLAESGAVILSARKFYISEPEFTVWFSNQKA